MLRQLQETDSRIRYFPSIERLEFQHDDTPVSMSLDDVYQESRVLYHPEKTQIMAYQDFVFDPFTDYLNESNMPKVGLRGITVTIGNEISLQKGKTRVLPLYWVLETGTEIPNADKTLIGVWESGSDPLPHRVLQYCVAGCTDFREIADEDQRQFLFPAILTYDLSLLVPDFGMYGANLPEGEERKRVIQAVHIFDYLPRPQK